MTRERSSHNSDHGALTIYADYGWGWADGIKTLDRGATLFCRAETAFIGADGIRLAHAIDNAIREAERIAYRAGQRDMRRAIEDEMDATEAKGDGR